MKKFHVFTGITVLSIGFSVFPADCYADNTAARKTLMSALLGAGTGAISAEASGGKAGKGALIGMGTNVIGTALFDFFLSPGTQSAYAAPAVSQSYAPVNYVPVTQPVYQTSYYGAPDAVTTYPAYSYSTPVNTTSQDQTRNILKNGLMGAATGAISSEVSDGSAGKGALIGAGTQVIGSALLDVFLPSPQPSVYSSGRVLTSPARTGSYQRKIVRTYDAQGNLLTEEEYIL